MWISGANSEERIREHGRRDENGAPMPTDSREGDRIFEFECTLEELYRGCSKRLRIPPTNGLQEEIVDVHVKPGWKKGTKLTYESRGAPARDGKRGNLVLICKEVPHPVFRRARIEETTWSLTCVWLSPELSAGFERQ